MRWGKARKRRIGFDANPTNAEPTTTSQNKAYLEALGPPGLPRGTALLLGASLGREIAAIKDDHGDHLPMDQAPNAVHAVPHVLVGRRAGRQFPAATVRAAVKPAIGIDANPLIRVILGERGGEVNGRCIFKRRYKKNGPKKQTKKKKKKKNQKTID